MARIHTAIPLLFAALSLSLHLGCSATTTQASPAPEAAPTDVALADSQPNIIFIFTDDHAPHAISAYGSVINETPNIDRLAEEGMLFR